MAKRRRSNRSMKMQPAITDLYFKADLSAATGTGGDFAFIDTARALSKVNRRLYEQGRMYAFQGLTFIWKPNGIAPTSVASIDVTVSTAGNTWAVQNAFVKGKALWHQMQELVLDDNPSITGKWHDYKIQMHEQQLTSRTLKCRDAAGTLYGDGEWNYSTYVMPQHEVDPVTGLPLPADQISAVLIGPDAGSGSRVSLLNAYQESRATVQDIDPNVPAGLSNSFFNLLTDSGSQEPELADVIEAENDQPPYELDNYPSGATNGARGSVVQYGAISAAEVDGRVGGFIAPCGLLQLEIKGYDSSGNPVDHDDMPEIDLLLHVAPGMYKGVAAIPMGQ